MSQVSTAVPEASAAGTAVRVVVLVVVLGWVLLFVVLIGLLITFTLLRGRRQRQGGATEQAPAPDPQLPARLAQLRSADPRFDEQLLLEVAQVACLLMFAAQSTGDEQGLRRLAASSFWSTFLGRYVAMSARDARQERDPGSGRGMRSRRHARLPVDFQAAAPELISVELGAMQRARVRVSFSQLRAVLGPGAHGQVAAASAASLGAVASAIGASMSSQIGNSATGGTELSWVAWAGRYDLEFARPAEARTDPAAALASRTCAACGAAYRSDLSARCEHCGTERPLAWGEWRLASITPVPEPAPARD